MTPATPSWRPVAAPAMWRARARLLQRIRAFFAAAGVLEVDTPQLAAHAVTDPHIDSLPVQYRGRRLFLNTSPEYPMKRLLAACPQPIYQICHAFREDAPGPYHQPEFSLLEWYRPGFTLEALMDELAALIIAVSDGRFDEQDFQRLSYRQAFEQTLGLNPHACTVRQCRQRAEALAIAIPQGMDMGVNEELDAGMEAEDSIRDDWLDWLLVAAVLPALPGDRFTLLYDYPASQAALARVDRNAQGEAVAKRFELLFGELELANAFDELTDAAEQRDRFARELALREAQGRVQSACDENLLAALEHGLPACSGIALGLDRLLMVLEGAASIDQVMTFPVGGEGEN